MMQAQKTEINPISPRANAKTVTVNDCHYLIGGMTADQISSAIYQYVIRQSQGVLQVQWKQLQFKKKLFKNLNSFAACGVPAYKDRPNLIYIWGGLQSSQIEQKAKSQLIEINLDLRDMRFVDLKQNIKIHSASLMYEHTQQGGRLVGFGGTDENSGLESFLYTLDLEKKEEGLAWNKVRLSAKNQGYIWQHSSHLTQQSLFDGQKGRFLTVVGGCRYPNSPYPSIVQFDLNTFKERNSTKMKYGLVSHDSLISNGNTKEQQLVIFGGSNGGDFSTIIMKLRNGELHQENAHPAVGCCVSETKNAFVVIGGVCGPMQINGVVFYRKESQKTNE